MTAQDISQCIILDTTIILDSKIASSAFEYVLPCVHDQKIGILLKSEGETSNIQARIYSLKGVQTFSAILHLPHLITVDRRIRVSSFAFNDSVIVLTAWKYILIYKYNTVNNFVSIEPLVIKTREAYYQLTLLNGYAFLWSCGYTSDSQDSLSHTSFVRINYDSAGIEYERALHDPEGVAFMLFQPRFPIDVSQKFIAKADITEYRIQIYDHNMNLLHSIHRSPPDWKRSSNDSHKSKVNERTISNTRILIDSLRSSINDLSMIECVKFINDSTMLLVWNTTSRYDQGLLKDKNIKHYDVWRAAGSKWTPLFLDLKNMNPYFYTAVQDNLRRGNLCRKQFVLDRFA